MSDNFEEILAKCLDRIESGASLESCLAEFPNQASELEPLLRISQQMRPLAKVGPRSAFTQNARQNLEKQLATYGKAVTFKQSIRHTKQEPRFLLQRRFSMSSILKFVIASFLALASTTAGIAFAAKASNPGDPLHGLELAMENVQLNLAPDVASKVQLRLQFASERLDEAQATFSNNDIPNGLEAVNEYGSEISAAAQLVGSAGGADKDALNALLETAQGVHKDVLTKLLDKVPDQAKDSIQKALDASNAPGSLPEAASGNHGNPKDTATPEAPVTPDTTNASEATEPPTVTPAPNGVGGDVSTCAKSISKEDAQALADLAKNHGLDYQYVLQNFCTLGTLDKVREMLAANPNVPNGVPAGPPSEVPSGKPSNVPGGKPSGTPGRP